MVELYAIVDSAVDDGDTVDIASAFFHSSQELVAFKAEIENHTKYLVDEPKNEAIAGHVLQCAVPIKDGEKEAICGQQASEGNSGCAGVVSWKIGNTGKMLVLMYHIRCNVHALSVNWCGVGIFPDGSIENYFNKMYYEDEVGFARKKFNSDDDLVIFSDKQFKVTATMETSHKPKIRAQFLPHSVNDLAASLKYDE